MKNLKKFQILSKEEQKSIAGGGHCPAGGAAQGHYNCYDLKFYCQSQCNTQCQYLAGDWCCQETPHE